MKLYHYVHCPFCVRVRMGLGLLNIKYVSVVLPYDDEKTPVELSGQKMLPIFVKNDTAQNESLDILKKEDLTNILQWEMLEKEKEKDDIHLLVGRLGNPIHSLCMPYWVWTPEFDESSRQYFQSKKEVKRGPFKKLIQNKEQYLNELQLLLEQEIEPNLKPYFKNESLSIADIMIASHLWGMYIFPEFQFSPNVHQYLQRVKKDCSFDYHQDFWK